MSGDDKNALVSGEERAAERAVDVAYARGRREAIEEAVKHLETGNWVSKMIAAHIRQHEAELTAKGAAPSDLPQRPGLEPWVRGPGGKPDNCAIANGAKESECQMCGGTCPDRMKGADRG